MKVDSLEVARLVRKDDTIQLCLEYTGDIHEHPSTYNKAYATILRAMADAVENVDDAFVDPEIVVWSHRKGKLTAEAVLSPM